MPYVVRLAQVVHQLRTHQDVSEKRGKNRWPYDRMQPLDIQNVHRRGQCESARRQHHAAQHVKADPDSPREFVRQIRRRAEPLREADEGRIQARRHQKKKNELPKCEPEFHFAGHLYLPPFFFFGIARPSAAATSSRRCVIHHRPPSAMPPSGTKSGMCDRTRYVSIGSGSFERLLGYPNVSNGTDDSITTDVPPTSSMP